MPHTLPSALNRSGIAVRGAGGPSVGSMRVMIEIVAMKPSTVRNPGTKPAGTAPRCCSREQAVDHTMTTAGRDEDTDGAAPPPLRPVASLSSYLYLRISGRAILPIVAAVARLEPQIAANATARPEVPAPARRGDGRARRLQAL